MEIDGHTRLATVIANPIKHSISPFIMNRSFQHHGLNAVYLAWEIGEKDLKETIENIRRYDMYGVNVSMPYKKEVMAYCDELTQTAQLVGAVNCIANQNGKLIGHNTDGSGFFLGLKMKAGYDVEGQEITILGGGGAATAIFTQAALFGARHITIFNQSQFLEGTRKQAETLSDITGVSIDVYPIEDKGLIEEMTSRSSLLVNATNVGMDGESMVIDPAMSFPKDLVVADVIYQPLETPFLKLVRSKGLVGINGLGMLLFQAAITFEMWTGLKMPTEKIWSEIEMKFNEE